MCVRKDRQPGDLDVAGSLEGKSIFIEKEKHKLHNDDNANFRHIASMMLLSS